MLPLFSSSGEQPFPAATAPSGAIYLHAGCRRWLLQAKAPCRPTVAGFSEGSHCRRHPHESAFYCAPSACTACWPKGWQRKCSAHLQPRKVFLLLLQSYEAIQRRAVPDTPLMHFLHLLIQASCCC